MNQGRSSGANEAQPPPVDANEREAVRNVRPRRRFWSWAALGLALVVIAASLAGLDRRLYEFSLTLNTPNPADADFYRRTHVLWDMLRFPTSILGGAALYLVIVLLHRRGWWAANASASATLAAGAVSALLRGIIARPRPNQSDSHLDSYGLFAGFHDHVATSFPSGEATMAFAFAAALGLLWPRARPVLYLLAVAVCAARLVQGSHYLSDVTAGAVIGVAVTRIVLAAIDRREGDIRNALSKFTPRSA